MERIREKARALRRQHQSSRLIEADQIAVANDDGVTSVKVTDPDTKNLIWCKLYGSDERIVQAYNGRVQVRDKLPVWLRQLSDGTYEVEGVRSRDGTEFLQEALGSMSVPELIGELMATVWAARNLKPGRARLSDNGGMNLHIEPFYYSGGSFGFPFGNDLDLTPYIPTTTGKQAWAVVWYDPGSDTLGATVGTEYDLPYLMNESDLGAVAIPPQYIPLAGVLLAKGMTTLTGSSIIIARQNWFNAPITDESFFPMDVTDTRTIPANRQLAITAVTISSGGSLTINGRLDFVS